MRSSGRLKIDEDEGGESIHPSIIYSLLLNRVGVNRRGLDTPLTPVQPIAGPHIETNRRAAAEEDVGGGGEGGDTALRPYIVAMQH